MNSESVDTINVIAAKYSFSPFCFSKPISDALYQRIHDVLDTYVKEHGSLDQNEINKINEALIDLAEQRKADST